MASEVKLGTGASSLCSARHFVFLLGLSAFSLAGPRLLGADDTAAKKTQQLVAAAAQAEVAGNAGQALLLLKEAVKNDPENQLARWQLGQVKSDGKWVAAEEAQRRAAADPLQAEYSQRRAAAGQSVAEQLVLARWCRENKLTDEAQIHWSTLLSLDPTNKEALRALDLKWKGGRLVSRQETTQQKKQADKAKDAAKRWGPIIAKWRRAVAGRDLAAHDAALSEIRSIKEVDAIPSMEAVTLGRDAYDDDHAEECLQIAVAFIDALGNVRDQSANESLVRHAVFSYGNKAKNAAVEKLKLRPQEDYVPLLLSGLAMPLESSFNVRRNPDGSVFYAHTLYREGQDSDWSYDLRHSAVQNDLGGRILLYDGRRNTVDVGPPTSAFPNEIAKKEWQAARNANRYVNAAAATESQVASLNDSTEAVNKILTRVLAETTGKELETPRAWWDWWRNQNEYYASGERPVDQHYETGTDNNNYGQSNYAVNYPPADRPPHSCFPKGTIVWTKTGLRPIETIEVGDLVLSQNVNTGELRYKLVLARTVRPPRPMLTLKLDNEELTTTLGHPFWVSGLGWRMAKELGDASLLHSVNGGMPVRGTKEAKDAEAYNLIVAGFNTYFVGASGVLVHDNTLRKPTQAIVPGLVAEN
jgi:hypothetical protein